MNKDFISYCSGLPFDYRRALSGMEAAAGINRYRFDDGQSCGIRVAEVYTAAGLRYTVLLDRGMDIGMASFRGIPAAFSGKNGVMRTDYAMASPKGFYQYFTAGLLNTCGLENVGEPCESDGAVQAMHGTRTFLPAFEVCCTGEEEKGEHILRVRGKMRIASLFGENILLSRELISGAETASVEIIDSVENQGSSNYEYMLMYHINFGFPLVSPDSTVHTNHSEVRYLAEPGKQAGTIPKPEEYRSFTAPRKSFSELTFEMRKAVEDKVNAVIENPKLGIRSSVSCDSKNLPCFTEWINLAEQDYVLGLEPGTHYPIGRAEAKKSCGLVSLPPGEKHSYSVKIAFEMF